jgi:transcriptional regulator with PAS, ATPase and Fis domain
MHTQDGIICLDSAGFILSSNKQARQIVGLDTFQIPGKPTLHFQDLFASDHACVMDAAEKNIQIFSLPLWSGLCVDSVALKPAYQPPISTPIRSTVAIHPASTASFNQPHRQGLKEVESELISKTLRQMKGNVAQTARALGISRATIYRKLK